MDMSEREDPASAFPAGRAIDRLVLGQARRDSGKSFSEALRISHAKSPPPDYYWNGRLFGDDIQDLSMDKENMHLVWRDSRSGFQGVWYGRVALQLQAAITDFTACDLRGAPPRRVRSLRWKALEGWTKGASTYSNPRSASHAWNCSGQWETGRSRKAGVRPVIPKP